MAQDISGFGYDLGHVIDMDLYGKGFFGGVGLQDFTRLKALGEGSGESVEGALSSGAAVDEIELGLARFFGVARGESEGHRSYFSGFNFTLSLIKKAYFLLMRRLK